MDEISGYQRELDEARQSGDREREKSALRSLASCYAHARQLELWIEYEKQALPIAHEQGEHREVIEILNNIASGCIDSDQKRLALQVLERALARARAHDLRRHEGLTLVNLARAQSMTDPNQGLSTYYQALAILRQFDEPVAQLSALEGIAWAELKMEHHDRAIECLEQAVDLTKQTEDRQAEGEVSLRLATAYGEAGRHGRAEERLRQSVSCFRTSGDVRGQAIALTALGTACFNQDKFDDAARALTQAREIFATLGLPEDIERCDHMLADLAQKRARRESVDPMAEARSLYERINRTTQESRKSIGGAVGETLNRAETSLARGGHAEALKELESRIAQARRARNFGAEAYLLILAGSRYAAAQKHQKGQEYIQKGMELAQQIRDRALIAQGHVELATVAFALRRTPEAKRHFSEALSISRAIGDRHYEHVGLGNLGGICVQEQLGSGVLGRMHLENDRVREGIAMLQEACDIAHQIGDQKDEATYCRNLGYIYLKLLLPYEALDAFERAQDLLGELGTRDPAIDGVIQEIRGTLDGRT
jgi:tetratricopeptide (TPR) repeat protein